MKEAVLQSFRAALLAVDPFAAVSQAISARSNGILVNAANTEPVHVPLSPRSKVRVISFGKASLWMAAAAEAKLSEGRGCLLSGGVAIVPAGLFSSSVAPRLQRPLQSHIFEAGENNLPDKRSVAATERVVELIEEHNADKEGSADDLILFLISGGGSALLCAPREVDLKDKLDTIRTLTANGADIRQLNTIRQCLSDVKGGRLLQRIKRGRALSLVLSDVIGDPLELIASGPTVLPLLDSPCPLSVLHQVLSSPQALLPPWAFQQIERASQQTKTCNDSGTVVPNTNVIICSNSTALLAMRTSLEERGYDSTILSWRVEGVARELGEALADVVMASERGRAAVAAAAKRLHSSTSSLPLAGPTSKIAIILGGETTVRLAKTPGKGGRNQEIVLSALIKVADHLKGKKKCLADFCVFSGGTDGQDGPTDAAGALFTLTHAESLASDPDYLSAAKEHLSNSDSYNFWRKFSDGRCHVITGPTGTNVMDVQVILLQISTDKPIHSSMSN